MRRRAPRPSQRLLGLAATLGIALFAAGTPVLLFAIGAAPTSYPEWIELRDALTRPDDGTLALQVLALGAWLAWLVMTTSLMVEIIARLRGIHAPSLPGLGLPQTAAGRAVATASLLFVALPVLAQSLAPALPAEAALPQRVPEPAAVTVADARMPEIGTDAVGVDPLDPATVNYTVKRGDSLWRIADRQLGDGKRYVEILELNHDVLHGKPDFITAGTVLRLPNNHAADPAGLTAGETYTVRPGDTLSGIALDELGDSERYAEIFEASRGTTQRDGRRLTDPNLIRPGWHLTIPGPEAHGESGPIDPEPNEHDPPPADPTPTPDPTPTGELTADPSAAPTTEAPSGVPTGATPETTTAPSPTPHSSSPEHAGTEDEVDEAAPGWLLPGLSGAGAVLAGGLLLAVRRHRRTQMRYRRPGHTILPPPPELLPVEATARVAGTTAAAQLQAVDLALRRLAASMTERPELASIEIASHTLVVHLAQDAHLPEPWEGRGRTWSLALGPDLAEEQHDGPDHLAPYPLLVTVGSDMDGHPWLLNLEQRRILVVTGDPTGAEALGRHLATELTVNPWSSLVRVDTLGFAAELASLDPLRLHHYPNGDPEVLDVLARNLTADPRTSGHDPDQFHAVLTTNDISNIAPVRKLVRIITTNPGRPGAALVILNGTPEPSDVVLVVREDGTLVIPSLELELTAVGLTEAEAAACAAIVDITRTAENIPTPADADASDGWQALTDLGGALRDELVEARSPESAGPASLLPLAASHYVEAAATTTEDIEILAPLATPQASALLAQVDPELDHDLEAWFSDECPLPRLTLLGCVGARTRGNPTAAVKRKPYYIELLAFLALHPAGATTDDIVTAFSITKNRARVDLTVLRSWLGRNPRTERDHLPDARTTNAAKERGTPAYQLEGVLCDLDLFRRLRARGQSRGAAGIDDLTTALCLVTGEPFTELREAGWHWLLEGDRLDHITASAIVDVAHIVATHALQAGDLVLARFAAETSCNAAPYDDIGRLDLVQVASLSGRQIHAERQLVDGVLNRSDDELGPVDLPERTARIVRQRTWLSRPASTN